MNYSSISHMLKNPLFWLAMPFTAVFGFLMTDILPGRFLEILAYVGIMIGACIPLLGALIPQGRWRNVFFVALIVGIVLGIYAEIFTDEYGMVALIVGPLTFWYGIGLGALLVGEDRQIFFFALSCCVYLLLSVLARTMSPAVRWLLFVVLMGSFLAALHGCKPYLDDNLHMEGLSIPDSGQASSN